MNKQTIYKSFDGERVLMGIYDRQLRNLNIDYCSEYVNTRFGRTHVIITGNQEGPPLVFFHGGNSTNPYGLQPIVSLGKYFKIISPDIIGHPGRSEQVDLSTRDNSYGEWMVDVLDELEIQESNFIGGSYGAGVLLRLATIAPKRITKAVFIVPSGIANISVLQVLLKLGLPMVLYRILRTRKSLINAVKPLSSNVNDDTLEMIEAVFLHMKVKVEMPRNATIEELKGFKAPTMVIAAEKDIMFPANKVIQRSEQIFPNLVVTDILQGATHMFQQGEELTRVLDLILQFLQVN